LIEHCCDPSECAGKQLKYCVLYNDPLNIVYYYDFDIGSHQSTIVSIIVFPILNLIVVKMADFDPEVFSKSDFSWEDFNSLKKDPLVQLAGFYKLNIPQRERKVVFKKALIEYLIDSEIVDESWENYLEDLQVPTKGDHSLEIEQMRLEFERERLAKEERDRERELEVRERLEREKLLIERERLAKKERELEVQERLEREKVKKEEKLEREKLEIQERLERERLELEREKIRNSHSFDPSKVTRLVPKFEERDVEAYFDHFEKIASSGKWPESSWAFLLSHVLVGKGRDAYNALSLSEVQDFNMVKAAVLTAYELRPEAYRQKFRNLVRQGSQSYMDFGREKTHLFNRWIDSLKVGDDFAKLRQAILLEEFKNQVSNEIRTYLEEQHVDTIEAAARLADDYSLTHKPQFKKGNGFGFKKGNDKPWFNNNKGGYSQTQGQGQSQSQGSGKGYSQSQSSSQNQRSDSEIVCFRCNRKGHRSNECRTRAENLPKFSFQKGGSFSGFKSFGGDKSVGGAWRKQNKGEKKNEEKSSQSGETQTQVACANVLPNIVDVGHMFENEVQPHSVSKSKMVNQMCQTDFVLNKYDEDIPLSFRPFTSEGVISSVDGGIETTVRMVRDTGANQTLVVKDLVKGFNVDENVISVSGVGQSELEIPCVEVKLKTRINSGVYKIGVVDELPIPGVHMLLGNDICGKKVTPEIDMVEIPEIVENGLDESLFPACAVTRSRARLQSTGENVSPEQTENGDSGGDGDTPSIDEINLQDTFMSHEGIGGPSNDVISKDNLVEAQRNDVLLIKLWDDALSEEEAQGEASCFYVKNGVLMRKWRPPETKPIDEWKTCHQIVVPYEYRKLILQLGHDNPLSGHMGVRRTFTRVTKHFYWPQVKTDVEEYCRNCDICQRVGKIGEKVPSAPLHPVPVLDEPFSDVVIDCVGPLPKTSKGNQYLLTIMCKTTRFPEAIPLRTIHSKKIIEALEKFFCLVGFPRRLQSDLGTNFTSREFEKKVKEWGVEHVTSSAYHPESQGVLERFHGTLKNMMKKFCEEFEKDWDLGVHLVLFAARDAIQESLGFSPFELVFGHEVRGPLKLLKDRWLDSDSNDDNQIEVGKFAHKLQRAVELAKENLAVSQKRMKMKYDKRKKVKNRKFNPGDKVLVLFPVIGNPLQAKFHGPYVVERKVSDVNYVVMTPDRRKSRQLCHINMLKTYHGVDHDVSSFDTKVVGAAVGSISLLESDDLDRDYSVKNTEEVSPKLKNSGILEDLDKKLEHLEYEKREELKDLILEFKDIFPDVPSRTDVLKHDVVLTDSTPIRQHPYRVNPIKLKQMEEEVQYMLDNDLIEPSQSEWASPCLLVPKSDNTNRFCTDFRKVNAVTKTDPFPIPRIESCIEKVGNSKYITKLDMLKGYWQVGLTERAKEISAFVTPKGLYSYKVMPFGMKDW